MENEVQNILAHYDIGVDYIEHITPSLVKVYSSQGNFALKKLKQGRNPHFTGMLQELSERGYSNYVSVYPNRQGGAVTPYQQNLYYLMPWFSSGEETERDEKHQYLFKEAALLHRKTMREIDITEEMVTSHYQALKGKWEKNKADYEAYVEECEKKWYLSPFELQAITSYIEVSRATDFALDKLSEWHESAKTKEKARVSLIHGKLSVHHYLYDDQGTGYFTNLENVHEASPVNELLIFFERACNTYPIRCEECIDWFYTHQKTLPFTEDEMNLFLSYLSYPDRLYKTLRKYKKHNRNAQRKNELKENTKLMKHYWQFKNIEYTVMRLTDIEEKKKEAAQAQT
ncbi:spore coat protein YsxE [Bacillus lacus]|uniref:Spore coat protein YsxE n=1 Tax=Metabacillus lacus TaxID=1983721 RepID=A0A7X2M140_9BACI|nr:spore coat protein YsxE [Metabacillus lacus]MRX74167.1 spore coat protein YsxE [Metabacillus lacus]